MIKTLYSKHYNIPIFIPEAACPHRCIFCNQFLITESVKQPTVNEVIATIEQYLSTIPDASNHSENIEIAFFGGSFTGIPISMMEMYLKTVQSYIDSHKVKSIRCSTRPDYITEEICDILKFYHVEMVELGCQSFDDEVLKHSGRGHTADCTINAVSLLKAKNIPFGLQMMTGLPSDTHNKSIETAQKIIELGALNTRIYPCLVIKDTPLEQLYKEGKFQPQTLKEAIDICSELVQIFEKAGVKVLRVGLHRSEGFDNKTSLISGPYHPQFKALVENRIWRNLLLESIKNHQNQTIEIAVPKGKMVTVIGHKKENKMVFEKYCKSISFVEKAYLENRQFEIKILT